MKNNLKKFFEDNREEMIDFAAGFVLGGLVAVVFYRAMSNSGLDINSAEFLQDTTDPNRTLIVTHHNNGWSRAFDHVRD